MEEILPVQTCSGSLDREEVPRPPPPPNFNVGRLLVCQRRGGVSNGINFASSDRGLSTTLRLGVRGGGICLSREMRFLIVRQRERPEVRTGKIYSTNCLDGFGREPL